MQDQIRKAQQEMETHKTQLDKEREEQEKLI